MMKLTRRVLAISSATLGLCMMPALASSYRCHAGTGQHCTTTNLDTKVVTTYNNGEIVVLNSGNWKLSDNWTPL
jgi:hypothetical protein